MSGQVVGSRVWRLRRLMHLFGPTRKAFAALDVEKQEALAAELSTGFDRATDGALVVLSKCVE